PLTAYDFEESWREYSDDQFPASLWEMVAMIKNNRGKQSDEIQGPLGIKALDAKTVRIQLENPTPYFLQLLAHPNLFPVHQSMRGVWQRHMRVSPEDMICSGPFKIKTYRDKVEIVLKKNPHYYKASCIFLDRIHMSRITDSQTAFALFEKKELDWLG